MNTEYPSMDDIEDYVVLHPEYLRGFNEYSDDNHEGMKKAFEYLASGLNKR